MQALKQLEPHQLGVMADVPAAANDPIFINHHAMIDCIFEEWLQRNPNGLYSDDDSIASGHRKGDYIVPFFPLYQHQAMFATANNFGYQCRLPGISLAHTQEITILIPILGIITLVIQL